MRIVVTSPRLVETARQAVEEVVAAIDFAASRFREDSELAILNAAPDREIKISPMLTRALAVALRAARLTDGVVDPTVGTAVRLSGYDRDFAGMAPDGPPLGLTVERVPGWRAIELDEPSSTVRVPRGVEIDLGATAKALASDLGASAALRAMGGGGVLVSLGGDISVAGDPPAGGWVIQVSEDSGAPIDERAEAVSIASGGIATSSIMVRRWTRGGVVYHHIIDPSTGMPAAGPWRTVSVVAGNCVDANIASTAAVIRGESAIAWLEARHLPARLVDQDGAIKRVGGWPTR